MRDLRERACTGIRDLRERACTVIRDLRERACTVIRDWYAYCNWYGVHVSDITLINLYKLHPFLLHNVNISLCFLIILFSYICVFLCVHCDNCKHGAYGSCLYCGMLY